MPCFEMTIGGSSGSGSGSSSVMSAHVIFFGAGSIYNYHVQIF